MAVDVVVELLWCHVVGVDFGHSFTFLSCAAFWLHAALTLRPEDTAGSSPGQDTLSSSGKPAKDVRIDATPANAAVPTTVRQSTAVIVAAVGSMATACLGHGLGRPDSGRPDPFLCFVAHTFTILSHLMY